MLPKHWLQHPREGKSFHPTSHWEKFEFWVEQDAVQLGLELSTYYGLCSVYGLLQAFCLAVGLGLVARPI